jgi:hypothetical protein
LASARHESYDQRRGEKMKYGIAWLIGIPPILILAWFLFNNCG